MYAYAHVCVNVCVRVCTHEYIRECTFTKMNKLTGEKDNVADSTLEADGLAVVLDDGRVERVAEGDTEALPLIERVVDREFDDASEGVGESDELAV